jgi:4-amino-4-deoxy-L-arabinose transferase-like glycosyltransferase
MALSTKRSKENPNNRWIVFFIFLSANSALTFLPVPSLFRFAIVILGIILPFVLVWKGSQPALSGERPFFTQELFGPLSWIWIVLVFGAGVFLRFYKLEDIYGWPTGDEGWDGTLAIELSRHWTWQFFFTTGQSPPLPVWAATGLMKLGFSPFLSLWLPSALASTATLGMGTLAARQFFSKSFSLICGSLLALSFWPLLTARIAQPGIWLPLWACACFYLLGRFLKSEKSKQGREAALLGGVTGLGPLTFTSWPVLALLVTAVVFKKTCWGPSRRVRGFLWFGFFFLLSLLPLGWAAVREGFGDHASSVAAWSGWFPWQHQIPVVIHYVTCLFWGAFDPESAYTPVRGGFLNSLLGTFFFIGLLEIARHRQEPILRWFLPVFIFFLLPGLLTMNLEAFRIIPVMPLLLLMATLGVAAWLSAFPPGQRLFTLALLLFASTAMDLRQLLQPMMDPSSFSHDGRSLQRAKAFQILSSTGREKGPGLILSDFDPDTLNDTTLSVGTYPFNAARNPGLKPGQAQWAALFVNVNYLPYLQPRFPGAEWFWVGEGLKVDNGGYVLGVIPLSPGNRTIIEKWLPIHALFQETNRFWYFQNRLDWPAVLSSLRSFEPKSPADPFLWSVYWEKTAAYYYKKGDFQEAVDAYLKAINQGAPSAGLCFDLGYLLLLLGKDGEADGLFQRAGKFPLNRTASGLYLSRVRQ